MSFTALGSRSPSNEPLEGIDGVFNTAIRHDILDFCERKLATLGGGG